MMKKHSNQSKSSMSPDSLKHSSAEKVVASFRSDLLTPSELKQLREQVKKDAEYFRKELEKIK